LRTVSSQNSPTTSPPFFSSPFLLPSFSPSLLSSFRLSLPHHFSQSC
jgi:hypothetical protein